MVSRSWRKVGMGSYCLIDIFNFARQSSGHQWWSWLPNNVYVFNATKLYTLKMVKMVNIMLCTFYHNFKN